MGKSFISDETKHALIGSFRMLRCAQACQRIARSWKHFVLFATGMIMIECANHNNGCCRVLKTLFQSNWYSFKVIGTILCYSLLDVIAH